MQPESSQPAITFESALELARTALGTQEVERYKDDNSDLPLWTFVRKETRSEAFEMERERHFFMVGHESGRGVLYEIGIDAQTRYGEAAFSFMAGFQSQNYTLVISRIRKWRRSLLLFEAMELSPDQIEGLETTKYSSLQWVRLGRKNLFPLFDSQGQFVFENVDLKLHLKELCAAKFFKCFDYLIFEYDSQTGQRGREVLMELDHAEEFYDEFSEDGEWFWEEMEELYM